MNEIIHFTKAEGAQNDFVIVDDRSGNLSDDTRRHFAQLTAHRRKGVGSDGCIFIDTSDTHDFTMSFYNPDGSVGSMCGNGGRCAALYAVQNGIAGQQMSFDVLGRSYRAAVEGNNVRLSFPAPVVIEHDIPLQCGDEHCTVDFIDTGAPHVLLFSDQLPASMHGAYDELDMSHIGTSLRWHTRFAPRGANVNVLERDGEEIRIRTFEKGVEGETEACGTGTLAAGMSAHLRYGIPSPITLRTHGDDVLRVHFSPHGDSKSDPSYFERDLVLEGPAHLVYEGCIQLRDA